MLDKVKKVYYTVHIRNRQRTVNRKYEEEGLSDELLEEQININILKNKYDIVLKEDKVYEGYIQ